MGTIKYSPDLDTIANSATYYVVWEGLPELNYTEKETEKGPGWVYEDGATYVWIPPDAVDAYKHDKKTLFLAMNRKTQSGVTHTRWMTPQYDLPEMVIAKAINLNRDAKKPSN